MTRIATIIATAILTCCAHAPQPIVHATTTAPCAYATNKKTLEGLVCRESCTTNRITAGIGARVRMEAAIAQEARQKQTRIEMSVNLDEKGRDDVSSTWSGRGVPYREVSEEYCAGPEQGLICARICGLPTVED